LTDTVSVAPSQEGKCSKIVPVGRLRLMPVGQYWRTANHLRCRI